jgi:multiple sugar transport system ATP-binding protein
MNLRTAVLVPGGAQIGDMVVPLSSSAISAAHAAGLTAVTLGLRPESFSIDPMAGLPLTVSLVEELGADTYVYGTIDGEQPTADNRLVVRFPGRVPPRIGEIIHLAVHGGEEHLFDPDTGARVY